MMTQKIVDLKKRKGTRVDALPNPEGNRDDDINNEGNGISDSAFAQQLKQVSKGQR